jgi:hypothetical protein
VKGGAAVASQRFDIFNTLTGIDLGQAERTRWGGVVGVGLEYGLAVWERVRIAAGMARSWSPTLFRKAFHIKGNDDLRWVSLTYALQVF